VFANNYVSTTLLHPHSKHSSGHGYQLTCPSVQPETCQVTHQAYLSLVLCPAGKIGGKICLVTLCTILDTSMYFHGMQSGC